MDVLQSGIFSFTYEVLAPGELRSHGEILSMGCEIHGKTHMGQLGHAASWRLKKLFVKVVQRFSAMRGKCHWLEADYLSE